MEKQKNTILAIETSCDETAFSIIQDSRTVTHQVNSQAALHAEFGGVFPTLAKREHDKNFTPLLAITFRHAFGIATADSALEAAETDAHAEAETNGNANANHNLDEEIIKKIESFLSREDDLSKDLIAYFQSLPHEAFIKLKSNISAIAVTYGPGLEPALWVGISGAKALATIFDVPLYPINHMEGHIASVIASAATPEPFDGADTARPQQIAFPTIALLISGGHTELVHIESWHQYRVIGQTVDDAVGEAYDKVARLLGLPYPGGPQISRLADMWRANPADAGSIENEFKLPRPMIHSKDYNFSFSGLKTAALYAVRDKLKAQNDQPMTDAQKTSLAAEFEQAVVDTLIHKTRNAIDEFGAKTLIIGGGVIANQYIREKFAALCNEIGIALLIPEKDLATDNATMIGIVAHLQIEAGKSGLLPNSAEFSNLKAVGNLSL